MARGVKVIGNWPHRTESLGFIVPGKTRSQISFDVTWGYQGPATETRPTNSIPYFKLMLLPPGECRAPFQDAPWFREAEAAARAAGRSGVAIMAEYIRQLWTFAAEEIESALRVGRLKAQARFRFVFTLPADWPSAAAEAMEQAVHQALLSLPLDRPVVFVSEPEAAALAVVASIEKAGSLSQLKVRRRPASWASKPPLTHRQQGDTLTVVDAGGITVVCRVPPSLLLVSTDGADACQCLRIGSGHV